MYTTLDETLRAAMETMDGKLELDSNALAAFPLEVVLEGCRRKLDSLQHDEDAEFAFMLLLQVVEERDPEQAFALLEEALLHPYAVDKEHYLWRLERYPKERTIPLLLEAAPLIEPFDEYGGYALTELLSRLIAWDVTLPHNVIASALNDPSFRVQRIIVEYITRHELSEYRSELMRLIAEEEFYDPDVERQAAAAVEKWK